MEEPDEPSPDVFGVVFEDADPGLELKYDFATKFCVVTGFPRTSDGEPMEAEWRGSIPVGTRVLSVDGVDTETMSPQEVFDIFKCAQRPVRVLMRLPPTETLKDAYGFVRDSSYIEKETKFRISSLKQAERSNFQWLAFLKSLSGSDSVPSPLVSSSPSAFSDPSSGIQALRRDLNGCLTLAPFGVEEIASRVVGPFSQLISQHKRCWGNVAVLPVFPGSEAVSRKESPVLVSAGSPAVISIDGLASPPGLPTLADVCVSPKLPAAPQEAEGFGTTRPASFSEGLTVTSSTSEGNVAPQSPTRVFGSPFVGIKSQAGSSRGSSSNRRLNIGLSVPSLSWRSSLTSKPSIKQLEALVLSGVPSAFRASVWFEMSGAAARAHKFPPHFYEDLLKMGAPLEVSEDIVKDIDRTFPGHTFFEHDVNMGALQRVLTAFAVRNPEIGYCQSLNFVAGMLLLHLPEEDAFWILDVVVNEILPPGYYNAALTGLHADQRVLKRLLAQYVPHVWTCLGETGIDVALVCVEWLLCSFCTTLPTHTGLRVWDCLFLFGSQVLFRVALALFHLKSDRLLACQGDFGQLFHVLQRELVDVHDADLLIKTAFPTASTLSLGPKLPWASLTNETIAKMRCTELRKVEAELQAMNDLRSRALSAPEAAPAVVTAVEGVVEEQSPKETPDSPEAMEL